MQADPDAALMAELRYSFGKNWGEFVDWRLDEGAIGTSAERLAHMLRAPSLNGVSVLDIGCGSGLHSLAALRLGAERVVSFDYDQDSVATTMRLRETSGISEDRWSICQGSVLDPAFIASLGTFDIVYSWGVLHHTGDMWRAIDNAMRALKPDGVFYIALYSSDVYVDPTPDYWIRLKRAYNQASDLTRTLMELRYAEWRIIGSGGLSAIRDYNARGMAWWTDVKDWLGGYPIEFAGFQETRDYCRRTGGLDLVNLATGEGCTEYVFTRLSSSKTWQSIETARSRADMRGPFPLWKGAAWRFPLARLHELADSADNQRRSPVMVYENGEPLGLAHALHADIASLGGGRFSHWHGEILFSASDNSDPNKNGRRYTFCEAY
jgi:SAM-dependent methyltransferase